MGSGTRLAVIVMVRCGTSLRLSDRPTDKQMAGWLDAHEAHAHELALSPLSPEASRSLIVETVRAHSAAAGQNWGEAGSARPAVGRLPEEVMQYILEVPHAPMPSRKTRTLQPPAATLRSQGS